MYKSEIKEILNVHQKPSYHPAMDSSELYIAKIRAELDKPIEKIEINDNEFSVLDEFFKKDIEIDLEDNEVNKEECELSLEEIVDRELEDKIEDNYYEEPRIP
jgi:hypothetical protein